MEAEPADSGGSRDDLPGMKTEPLAVTSFFERVAQVDEPRGCEVLDPLPRAETMSPRMPRLRCVS